MKNNNIDLDLIKLYEEVNKALAPLRNVKETLTKETEKIRKQLFNLAEAIERLDKGFSLLSCSRQKLINALKIIKDNDITECVLVYQGLDIDSLSCGWLFREIMRDIAPQISTEKAIIYFYNGAFTLDKPLTNYLSPTEIFKGDDNLLYIFIDNSLTEEARALLNIKNYLAFDNHTKLICDKTDIEKKIIAEGLGQRNLLSSAIELKPLIDKPLTEAQDIIINSADSVNKTSYDITKNKQLKAFNMSIKQYYKKPIDARDKAFYYDCEQETIRINEGLISVELGFDKSSILEALAEMLPQGTFKQARKNGLFNVPCGVHRYNDIYSRQEVLSDILSRAFYNNETIEQDSILIYNDNLVRGQHHYVNYLIKNNWHFDFN